MSTTPRELILKKYHEILVNKNKNTCKEIIAIYSEEFSKKPEDIDKFIRACEITNSLQSVAIEALFYYGAIHNIILITKNNIILKIY